MPSLAINQLDKIPMQPGCYLFKNKDQKIIYVGKAKSLRKRVSNYFQKNGHDAKTNLLVQDIASIDFFVTDSEVEALLLENTLIKKHYPHYNLDLKDSRRYAYLRLMMNAPLPWLEVARTREGVGELYGPFVSGQSRKYLVDVLSRTFKILLKKPSARMQKIIDPIEYHERVAKARAILKGNIDELKAQLEKDMQLAARRTFYEYALTLKHQIEALESLKEKQNMELTRSVDAHIINYLIVGEEVHLMLFSIRKGVLEGKQEFSFARKEEFLDEFILRYYDAAPVPREIILPQEIDPALIEYLRYKRRGAVDCVIPHHGEKKELLELVLKNIHATFFAGADRLRALQEVLALPHLPRVMECFDISHLSGTNTVASMVTFNQAMPDKSSYRKFRLRTPTGGDDFLALTEVLTRRYSRLKREQQPKPDLVIIDGGLGQLNVARNVLAKLGLKLPVIALAKRLEEIYSPTLRDPLRLPHSHKGLHLLQAIRDEAHRFALTYQRKLRSRGMFESA